MGSSLPKMAIMDIPQNKHGTAIKIHLNHLYWHRRDIAHDVHTQCMTNKFADI